MDFHGDVVRNIKGIRVSQSLFDDLSPDPRDQAVAIAAESAERIPTEAPLLTRAFDYGSVITYPFVPHNWHATRWSDGLSYGVWYGSLALETTVVETVYHWHRFVMDAFPALGREITGERRVLDVHCAAILIDLRRAAEPRLTDRRDYAFPQALGRHLHERSQNGVLCRSARCDGNNAAIFDPRCLSDVRDRCFLTYRMWPSRDHVQVERTPGETWLEINPSSLY
ncbi:MAG TPA: RES family NAD+ phosphorylase [Burkholderiales bacterium]|nr:RES family NAD+ phosphorylase [Burkholderiales bacterium]